MHAAFRTEFGRLAAAFQAPRDAAHVQLLEEHLALALDILHAHHTHEDDNLWPFLISCSPQSEPEARRARGGARAPRPADHRERRPVAEQVGPRRSLQELHDFLNRHIDHEEAVAFPLMRTFLTPQDVEDDRRKAMSEISRQRMPVVFGWIASCLDDDLFAAAMAENPRVVRLLFRKFWWPKYQRRLTALYGRDVVVPAKALAPARSVVGAR